MVRSTKKFSFGLTLIELMVTIAVLAFITAIGYPLYTAQVQKGRRVDARSGVMELAMAEERERAAWGGYSEPSVAIPGITSADSKPIPNASSVFHEDLMRIADQYGEFYSFNITADQDTFTIEATPVAPQDADTTCDSFAIDQAGRKFAIDQKTGTETAIDPVCW
jgi:type IV pilus assembly protein PilE